MRHQIIKQKQNIAHKTIQPSPFLATDANTPKRMPSPFATICEPRTADSFEDKQESGRARHMIAHFQKKITDSMQYKILRNVFRSRELEAQESNNKSNIKSEKLVGKESFIVRELSPQVARLNKKQGKAQVEEAAQQKEDRIQTLLKLNQNMRNISGETNAFLLRSIEMLRCSEKEYLNLSQEEYARKESIVDLATLQNPCALDDQLQSQQNCNVLRSLKEQAALKFKEKIKIKQSRRHIYRTLKNKNDNWHKIRQKTHHISPQKQRAITEVKENSELQLIKVQCPEVKNSYNIRSSNFRSLTKTYYENMRDLRVQSKQQSQQGQLALQLRTTKCHYLNTEGQQEGKSWGKGKKKSGIEVYEQMVSKLRKGKSGQENIDQSSNCSPRKNVFRQLTPWHFQECH